MSVSSVGASLASGCLFVCFEQKKLKNPKTGLHTNLLFTYDWNLHSLIILYHGILKIYDNEYYGSYNE